MKLGFKIKLFVSTYMKLFNKVCYINVDEWFNKWWAYKGKMNSNSLNELQKSLTLIILIYLIQMAQNTCLCMRIHEDFTENVGDFF